MAPYHAFWAQAGEILAAGFRARGRRRARLRVAIALALGFDTHRTLTSDQGLTDDEAAELMVRLVEGC